MADNQVLGPDYYVKHVAIISVFSGLAPVAVALRLWSRKIQKMSLELNDYLIVAALLCALGLSAINIYGCCFGLAKNMNQEDIMKAMIFSQKSQFMSIIIWVASVTFIRTSIITLYIRLFPTRIFRKVCYLVIATNLCFFVAIVLADCLMCQPISYRWDQLVGGTGSCADEKPLDLFIGIFNLILDVAAVVLPMPVLWGLKMAMGKRLMLVAMFGMGTIICALTIYRIYDTATISPANAQEAYAVIALLTSLEALLGIITACFPIIKPIFNRMRGTGPQTNGSGVREISKSGSIPIFMRLSQMLTLTSSRRGKASSSDEETLTEAPGGRYAVEEKKKKSSSNSDDDVKSGGKEVHVTTRAISSPMSGKAERLMGIKGLEVHVRQDVDVESTPSLEERRLVSDTLGGKGRWDRPRLHGTPS